MPDGNARRRDDGELPPDPWAGLAGSVPPRAGEDGWGDPTWTPPGEPVARPPGWRSHPSVASGRGFGHDEPGHDEAGHDAGHVPPPRRTVWHHPAVWVVLLVLAVVLLLTALLEPRTPPPSEPSPDAVTATAPIGGSIAGSGGGT